jgi:hypothetical protein
MKGSRFIIIFTLLCVPFLTGCYSFTGATIDGKTLFINSVQNRAASVAPTLAPTLTEKLRSRILSQTGLAPVSTDDADYTIASTITSYAVSIAGVSGTQTVSTNRLTIALNVSFTNRKNPKADFEQSFTRFADFDASQPLQSVEGRLIEEIGEQLADDIFNKAFVNW